MYRSSRWATLVGVGLVLVVGCDDPPPGKTYYERNIEPILLQSCARNTSGCHSTNSDDPFDFAAGNFDVTSFDNVQKRRDLLEPFGAYPLPLLLIKSVAPGEISMAYGGGFLDLEVVHTGGAVFAVGSDAYLTLLDWTAHGATANGLAPPVPPQLGEGTCSTALPSGFDPAPFTGAASFGQFRDNVQPILERCSSGSCHGAPQSDFYITCGDDDAQLAFNFSQARSFVDDPVENSQILQVPLAVGQGGRSHTGGDQFASKDAADYLAIKAWAEEVDPFVFGEGDPADVLAAKTFFAERVQPILLVRGCASMACHSPAAANDFKLRPGSQGFFSVVALERNYELLRDEFMALEYPDSRRGRAVAKGIGADVGGIAHRGGSVLETQCPPGVDPDVCLPDPANCTDAAVADSAFCTVQEWIRLEREILLGRDEVLAMGSGDAVPLVYVERQASHVATPLEFDTYQPSSDLLVADLTLGAAGAIASVGAPRSLLDNCPGAATRTTVDVRSPDVRFDGSTVAFAMRTSASEPLGIYTVGLDGQNCVRLTPAQADVSGLKIHDFDPAWSPDGAYVVFASTRGAAGPTRSRKLFLPQSDLWRMTADGGSPEQLTFLTNSELAPQFMREGRITMTTEKVSAGFYQLAGRRINWDRTDYHPLLAQRAESPYASVDDPAATAPSVGYAQATDIRESSDGDFLLILSDAGARGGAGTLAVFNRSVGTIQADRNDPGYLRSMRILDPAATGRAGSATSGAYRNPVDLPDGRILVSYAAFSGDLGTATSLDWDLVAVDRRTGARTPVIPGAGAQVDGVLALKRPPGKLYLNRRQLVFGGGSDGGLGAGEAVLHLPDAPMVFTVLTGNLRRGRPVDQFRAATEIAIYEEEAAPAGTTSGSGEGGIYESRRLLGTAALASDGSAKLRVPAGKGLILELRDGDGAIVTMGEEHQLGPQERISMGVRQPLFDAVCGGCHGSVTGSELDVAVTPDALTGASASLSAERDPVSVGN